MCVLLRKMAMLDKGAGMRIPFDAVSFGEAHAHHVRLAEAMAGVGAHRDNSAHIEKRHTRPAQRWSSITSRNSAHATIVQ